MNTSEDIRFAHTQIHQLINRLSPYRGAGVFPDGTIDRLEDAAEAIDMAFDKLRMSDAKNKEPYNDYDGSRLDMNLRDPL